MIQFVHRLAILLFLFVHTAYAQVDTSLVYNTSMPYGTLDLRISKSANNYYYLKENETFSYRTENGVKTNSFLDMTAWDSDDYLQGNLREKNGMQDLFVMNYRILLPEGYDANYADGYPIVIFFHGLHEGGNCAEGKCYHATRNYDGNVNSPPAPVDGSSPLYNNDYTLVHGAFNYLSARNLAGKLRVGDAALPSRAFPGIVLFPQSNNEWDSQQVEDALRLLRLVMKKYNVNENRVYVNGLSKGGYAAYEALNRAGWMFCAGVLFSAISDAQINTNGTALNLAHVPLWIFQGGKDGFPLPAKTEDYVRSFKSAGLNVRYKLYGHLGHGTWNEALEEPDFFSWLLSHSRDQIRVLGADPNVCATDDKGVTLILPQGMQSYEWTYNGIPIQNAAQRSLVAKSPGTYSGRFLNKSTGGTWSTWSKIEVGKRAPQALAIQQIGTLHLPDLNNSNAVMLEAARGMDLYRWYRDNKRVDLPGNMDDTIRQPLIQASYGSGAYTVRAATFNQCFSPPSLSKKIHFNNSSPLSLTPPGLQSITAESATRIVLKWTDQSEGEDGFEIWRLKRINNTDSEPWTLVAITFSNATSFTDDSASPSTEYEYKIRAVSTDSRSTYEPAASIASATTLEDTASPSPPMNVSAELIAVNTMHLSWAASKDDAGIKEYKVHLGDTVIHTKSNVPSFIVDSLQTAVEYKVRITAVDVAGNESEESASILFSTKMKGLFYEHSTGAWTELSQINWRDPEYTGHVNDFTLSQKMQEDFFNFRFDGFLWIEKKGVYQFRITSDDGSRLSLNDTLLIENDGVHNPTVVTGPIQILAHGPQRITVDFFDYTLSDSVLVEYKGPDTNASWVPISEQVLKNYVDEDEPGSTNPSVSIYPNPTNGQDINIDLADAVDEAIQVTLYSSTGQLVSQSSYLSTSMPVKFPIEGTVRGGVYLLRIETKQYSVTRKLLIQ